VFKELRPRAVLRESELITKKRIVVEACHHDDVESLAVDPSMERDDPIVVARVVGVNRLPAQGGVIPAQPDEVLSKPQLIAHRCVAGTERRPLEEIPLRRRIVAPLAVLQKLLAHEDLRNPGRREQKARGYLAAAARVVRLRIGAIRKDRNAHVAPPVNEVMVFDAGHRVPCVRQVGRIETLQNGPHVHGGGFAIGRSLDGAANRNSKRIVLHGVESCTPLARGLHNGRHRGREFTRPVLGVLQQPIFDVAQVLVRF